MALMSMTLNDLEGHSPVAGLFKCNSWIIYVAFYNISNDSASRGPSTIAELLVKVRHSLDCSYTSLFQISSKSVKQLQSYCDVTLCQNEGHDHVRF